MNGVETTKKKTRTVHFLLCFVSKNAPTRSRLRPGRTTHEAAKINGERCAVQEARCEIFGEIRGARGGRGNIIPQIGHYAFDHSCSGFVYHHRTVPCISGASCPPEEGKGDERVECEQEVVLIIQIQFYSNFKSSIIHGFIDLFIYALLQNRDAVVVVY